MPNNIRNYTIILDRVYQREATSAVLNSPARMVHAGRNAKEIMIPNFVQVGAELQRTRVAPKADAFTYAQIAGHDGVTVGEADLSAAEAVDVLKTLWT